MLNYGTILLGSLKGDKCMIDYRKLADYIIITCNKENKDISNFSYFIFNVLVIRLNFIIRWKINFFYWQ